MGYSDYHSNSQTDGICHQIPGPAISDNQGSHARIDGGSDGDGGGGRKCQAGDKNESFPFRIKFLVHSSPCMAWNKIRRIPHSGSCVGIVPMMTGYTAITGDTITGSSTCSVVCRGRIRCISA